LYPWFSKVDRILDLGEEQEAPTSAIIDEFARLHHARAQIIYKVADGLQSLATDLSACAEIFA
jgi:hypothetical protein